MQTSGFQTSESIENFAKIRALLKKTETSLHSFNPQDLSHQNLLNCLNQAKKIYDLCADELEFLLKDSDFMPLAYVFKQVAVCFSSHTKILLEFSIHNAVSSIKKPVTPQKKQDLYNLDPQEALAEKHMFLKQKIQHQREEIDGFKQEIRELREMAWEKQRHMEEFRDKVRYLEKNKLELEEAVLKQVRKEKIMAESNEKQRQTIIYQRNSLISKKSEDKSMEKSIREFEKQVLESMDDYLAQKTIEKEEDSFEMSYLLKKVKEKAAKIEQTLKEEMTKQENDEDYKEIQAILKNPMEKTANLCYSGAKKKLKLIYGKMINQGNRLTSIEDELKKNIDSGSLMPLGTLNTIDSESDGGSKISIKEQIEVKKKLSAQIKKRMTFLVKLDKETETEKMEDVPMTLLIKIQTLEEEKQRFINEIEKMTAELEKKTLKIEEMRVLTQNSLKIQCELQDSQLKQAKLQKDFHEKCQEFGLIEEKLEKKKEKIRELKQILNELQEKKENMAVSQFLLNKNDELEKYRHEIEELKKTNKALEDRFEESKKQVKDYKDELSSAIFTSEPRKSFFFPGETPSRVSLKEENLQKVALFQGDLIKKIDKKRAALRSLMDEEKTMNINNDNSENKNMGIIRRGSSIPFKNETIEEKIQLEKVYKRGSAMMNEKEREMFEKLAKTKIETKEKKRKEMKKNNEEVNLKELEGKKHGIIEKRIISIEKIEENNDKKENIKENNKKENNKKENNKKENNKKENKKKENNKNENDIKEKNIKENTQKKEEKLNEDYEKNHEKIESIESNRTKSTKLPEFQEKKVEILPQKTPRKKERDSLNKEKLFLTKPPKIDSIALKSPPNQESLPQNPKSPEKFDPPQINLNKTSNILYPKPENIKKTSSFQSNLQIPIESKEPKLSFLKENHLSSTKIQRKLNILLSKNEKSQPLQHSPPNSFISQLNPLIKPNESTFFTPKPMKSLKLSIETSKKTLDFYSIPNIIHFTPLKSIEKSSERNPELLISSENKLPSLKTLNNKNRLNSYKSKINSLINEQMNLLTEAGVSTKKPSFSELENTYSELFPSVSIKNRYENPFFTQKRKDISTNIEMKTLDRDKIREFFNETESKSFFEDQTSLNLEKHKRNNSDNQLQLLKIDFSKVKEKPDIQEEKLIEIYRNLEKNDRNKELLRQMNVDEKPYYEEFKEFVAQFERKHEKCGKNCLHLKRFYEKLGWEKEKREFLLIHKREIKKI